MLNHTDLMAALTADYLNIYVLKPDEDEAYIIKLQGYVTAGITENPGGFVYSKLLATYAGSRVYEADRENFLKSLSSEALLATFSDGRESYECNYRIREKGAIHYYTVRYSRISKEGEKLMLVVAFRNIDSVVNVGLEEHTKGLYSAYGAISSLFFSLHRIDIQDNTYTEIKSAPAIMRLTIPGSSDYDANSERIIRGVSSKWSMKEALRFVERRTLEKRLGGRNHITMDFISYADEACRLHFFREDNDETGRLWHVIFGVEKIDETESQAIINVLSRDYQNVFSINLSDGSSRILKTTGSFGSNLDGRQNRKFNYGDLLKNYIAQSVHPDERKTLERDISIENLKRVFSSRDEFSGTYRAFRDGAIHHYRYTFFHLPSLNSVVAGFRNIDDIIAKHEEEEREKREKEKEYEKQREEQLAIFDTLARNFKNVYMVDIRSAEARILKLEDEYVDHRLDGVMTKVFSYEAFLNEWIEEKVHPDDRKMLSDALGIENLRKVMAEKDEYTGNYRIVIDGEPIYYQFRVALMPDRVHLIAGFQNVNGIIREHLEEERRRQEKEAKYQAQLREQLVVFDTLARNFRNVYLADMEKKTMKVLKLGEEYGSALNLMSGREVPFDAVRTNWIENIVCSEDREEVSASFRTENVIRRLTEEGEFSGHYRSLINGKLHHFQYSMSRVNLPGMKAVLGFQNVDDIVEEHLEKERREREMEEERLRREKEHAEVISAVSAIYSTIFLADILTHSYEVLTSVPFMEIVAGSRGNFDYVKNRVLSVFVADGMQSRMEDFLDLESLPSRLSDTDTVSTEYRNHEGRWYESRFIVKRREEDGKAREVLYVARDITKEKNLEIEQQEKLSAALHEAQIANRAKTTFLSSMSHDIRTPMNAIIGFTALAETNLDNTALVRDYLKKIGTSGSHLLSLINDILDMSRIESGTVKLENKPIHLPLLLHDLRTMIQGLVNSKNLHLYIDTEDVVHEDVSGDRLRLNQIMINIAGNAIKYTGNGGSIWIKLKECPSETPQRARYEFSVRDNGIGISKEFQKHIFESFSRERSSTVSGVQGTGLGMAITKNIVDMKGGEIRVESEEGKGSLFTVSLSLPLSGGPVKEIPVSALIGERALVVDDDLDTCRSVTRMLRDIEMRPDWTTSGREAVARSEEAREIGDEYKVYIIDYLMPDMNGIETVRELRKVIDPGIPVIVLTAYDWADIESEARDAGVTAFVTKPIFMSELRSALSAGETDEKKEDSPEAVSDYSGKRVLVVEDNELNREIATALLETTGLSVDTACDGMEAVDIMYRSDEDRYDLIFMDIQMPRMDGYTATHEIRTLASNRKANIPIVAMTANAFEEDRIRSLEAGMNAHISKPVSIGEIVKVLDRFIGGGSQ